MTHFQLFTSPFPQSPTKRESASVHKWTKSKAARLQQCGGDREMSKSSQDRIGYVLEQLIQRTVPVYPDDDEETVEQRLDEAFGIADEIISRYRRFK